MRMTMSARKEVGKVTRRRYQKAMLTSERPFTMIWRTVVHLPEEHGINTRKNARGFAAAFRARWVRGGVDERNCRRARHGKKRPVQALS